MVSSIHLGPWEKVGTIRHEGVDWIIRVPEPPPHKSLDPESAEADRTPLCPECSTELEERKSRLFGYRWTCVGCGFSKRNSDPFTVASERASKDRTTGVQEGSRGRYLGRVAGPKGLGRPRIQGPG